MTQKYQLNESLFVEIIEKDDNVYISICSGADIELAFTPAGWVNLSFLSDEIDEMLQFLKNANRSLTYLKHISGKIQVFIEGCSNEVVLCEFDVDYLNNTVYKTTNKNVLSLYEWNLLKDVLDNTITSSILLKNTPVCQHQNFGSLVNCFECSALFIEENM